jgi:hypothetical protein
MVMLSLSILIFLSKGILLSALCSSILSNTQIGYIRNIITNPNTPPNIRIQIQQIIAEKYYFWTLKQVRLFKETSKKYKKYENPIMNYELNQYALTGLMKSIMKYNGSGYFHKYAEKYVHGELCLAIRDRIPMQPLKHWELFSNNPKINSVTMVSFDEEWKFDTNWGKSMNDDVLLADKIKEILYEVSLIDRRMFYYRYDMDSLKPIRTIKKVCILMCFSEETYRARMRVLKKIITDKLDD